MRRLVFLLAITALVAATASALAGAASAGVSPTGAKTGTTTGSVEFNGTNVTCTGATFTATWSSPTVPPYVISTNMLPAFSGCTRTGGVPVTIACASTAVLTVTGSTVSGITPMTYNSWSCTLSTSVITGCRATLSGGVNAPYDNIPVAMVVSATGQTLAVSGTTCAAIFANGATRLQVPGGLTPVTYHVSPSTTVVY